jgi:hypothetical protein
MPIDAKHVGSGLIDHSTFEIYGQLNLSHTQTEAAPSLLYLTLTGAGSLTCAEKHGARQFFDIRGLNGIGERS